MRPMSSRLQRILAVVVSAVTLSAGCAETEHVEPQPEPTRESVTPAPITVVITPPPSTTSTTTTTTIPVIKSGVNMTPEEVDAARLLHGQCGEWYDLAISVGWDPSDWEMLSKVIYRESRCTPTADSGPDHGLTQINRIHSEWLSQMGLSHEMMFDPELNLKFALLLRTSSGWKPWKSTVG